MSDNIDADASEAAPLTPAQRLVDMRSQRDEQRYRQRCEDTYGMIAVGPETIHPADVLDACRADAARRGRDESWQAIRGEVEDTVCERFPTPIAVPFNAFLHGSLDPLKRMLHLRDSWEALIHLLSALALSDCASAGAALGGFDVRNSEAQVPRACNRRDLRTDSLAMRIGLIEGVINRAKVLNLELAITRLIDDGVLSEIRRLNAVRNGFSHEAVKSDTQATEIIEDAYPLFREILVDLSDLAQVELFRPRLIKPGSPPRGEVERLQGYAQGRRVKEIALDAPSFGVTMSAYPVGRYDRILALLEGKLVDLSPFFYAFNDATGHRTRVGFFKFNKEGKWFLEVVGESESLSDDDPSHEVLMERFYALLERDNQA